jgi:hypothetical protein
MGQHLCFYVTRVLNIMSLKFPISLVGKRGGGLPPRNDVRVSNRDFTSATSGSQTIDWSDALALPTFAGWKAFDSSNTSAWLSVTGLPDWISIDFGIDQVVYSIMYDVRDDADGAQSPKDFVVQSSDDNSNWTTRLTVTNATKTNGQLNFDLDEPAIARYWRLYCTATNSAENRVGLAIMEYYS